MDAFPHTRHENAAERLSFFSVGAAGAAGAAAAAAGVVGAGPAVSEVGGVLPLAPSNLALTSGSSPVPEDANEACHWIASADQHAIATVITEALSQRRVWCCGEQ